jgi:hypothetical protein
MRLLLLILLTYVLLLAAGPNIIQCSAQSACTASADMDTGPVYVAGGS